MLGLGGILKYLEEVPAEESKFEGSCFIFDERDTVKTGLAVEKRKFDQNELDEAGDFFKPVV